ncbi:mast cell protease 9-like [Choristoneura fumiferana]|uniref:mast cell protease 9-like n=1 Tax=Choristoneura fumiferana TaxID=7141 RepID=UPI003D15489A
MNFLLKIVFLFNVLQNDGNCLHELLKDQNATEDAPHFRIFYGKEAEAKQFPYQVSMKIQSRSTYYTFCGGTIIAPSKVLSAAHCFYNNKKSPCGCTSISVDSFTSTPYIYNEYVNQIPYATEHKTYTGLKCTASGYGQTERKRPSEVLLYADLEVITTATCNRLHNANMRRFVCTSGAMTDVGKGDSGGPLVCKNTGHYNEGDKGILVGVTSGKRESRRPRKGTQSNNAFFTRVSYYDKFIKNNKAVIIVPDCTLWILSALSFIVS